MVEVIIDDPGKRFGQEDVIGMDRMGEERRYIVGRKAGYAAADRRNEEGVLGMGFGESYKLIHIGTDGLHPTLHGRDGIALALQTNALPPYGTKAIVCDPRGATSMGACQITAEDKYLVRLQLRNPFRCKCSIVHRLTC